MKFNQQLFGILLISILPLSSCSTINKVNKLNKDGYTFIVDKDTMVFDKLYLDDNFDHNFEIDKDKKTIRLITTTELEKLVSVPTILKIYSTDTNQVVFLIFNGSLFDSSSSKNIYSQYSLINEIDARINKDSLNVIGAFCSPPNGDIIIIN